ncbi:hypothetical protein PHJA_001817800 [Phtheirospermum japonicum]|uniref:Uncharacterized protein n=1 Tax=Phtheirospermum japonicum TaxID=374723 RepID=A0A830C7Q1_9LAMI|nr:hypothetical protein PHJA_001817800 [Phtheirospermum japonicum]
MEISDIMKSKYDQPWIGWHEVSTNVKNCGFESFRVFLGGILCMIEKFRRYGEQRKQREWTTDPRFQRISDQNKKNIATNKDGYLNRGGAISTSKRRRRYTTYKKLKASKIAQGITNIDDSQCFYEATRGCNKRGHAYMALDLRSFLKLSSTSRFSSGCDAFSSAVPNVLHDDEDLEDDEYLGDDEDLRDDDGDIGCDGYDGMGCDEGDL